MYLMHRKGTEHDWLGFSHIIFIKYFRRLAAVGSKTECEKKARPSHDLHTLSGKIYMQPQQVKIEEANIFTQGRQSFASVW